MIDIFTKQITPRIDFAFRLIFETILEDQIFLFSNENDFLSHTSPIKINYSDENLDATLKISPLKLLYETDIHEIEIKHTMWDDVIAIFPIESSSLPFDLFAASFFLVTRYEEYWNSGERDQHNRFKATQSIAYKLGFLELPLIDVWATKLASLIEEKSSFRFKKRSFKYQPSIDIDNAFAFLGKSLFRNIAATGNDIIHQRWSNIPQRAAVLCKKIKDPYDNYNFIEEIVVPMGFKPIFFILLNKHKKFDRSLSFKNKFFQKKIKELKDKGFEIGIHPSYQSNYDNKQLGKEIDRFSIITGFKPTQSRQHYLMLKLPQTYQNLIAAGITDDYTMGYASCPGFRASTCTPFLFFDLEENKTTPLTVHPFAVMDVTLRSYQKLNLTQASEKIKQLMENVAKVGGTFIGLWHNESLSDKTIWKGWRKIYSEMSETAKMLKD